jgi:RNA polymerase sigma factor (sigma-70 family)
LQIRRELRDLKRHYFGPQGIGANHGTAAGHASDEESNPGALEPPDDTHDPQRIGVWAELHEQVDKLPDAEREAFELIWYHRLTQMETAQVLGVSRRTVIRHWQSACLRLHEVLGSALIERQS